MKKQKLSPRQVLNEVTKAIENGASIDELNVLRRRLYALDNDTISSDEWTEKYTTLQCISEFIADSK